ncbi:MAG: winged helix-turn-helix transcriptional regulator [Kiritimatiellae bacterium]|nr:winged helix-turn-helix transcriptional regulator [Kiritimatiellia bacterium]
MKHEARSLAPEPTVVKSSVESVVKSGMKTADAIIAFMRADPQITHDLLAAKLGKARNSIIKQIAKLKKTGLIRRVGPTKGGHWEVIG